MDRSDEIEIKETDIWTLYNQSVSYCHQMGMYVDTDRNYRMYNGDQWHGLNVRGVEKVQLNFIKPIVRYKVGIVLSNLYAVNFSSENYENKAFRKNAEKICKLLNKKASKIWEKDYMDIKLRLAVKDAAINDEGIIFVYYADGEPVNEVLNKNDIYYGDENHSDIQVQPYILIKQRKPVVEVRMLAKANGVPHYEIMNIHGDMENIEEAGDDAKYEKDNLCTVVTKMYKQDGTVHFAQAAKYVEIKKDTDTGLTYYPVAHLIWEERVGSARGEGEVRHLIPNQLETNKTAMRRAYAAKSTAYPNKVVNVDMIENINDVEKVGGIIKITGGATVDDVAKIVSYINPAQMSTDVEKLQNELITATRELAGAGDIATGQINPESASGRAILAVQQASQQPLTEHLEYTKGFVEELARIWLDMLITYEDSIDLEDETTDPQTGETIVELMHVPQASLRELQATVKVDVTPRGAFDRYAQEQSLENLLSAGLFTTERMPELKLYIQALDDDSVMPKQKLVDIVEKWEKEQRRIAAIDVQARMMMQRAQQFLMGDPEGQASQIAAAEGRLEAAGQEDGQTGYMTEDGDIVDGEIEEDDGNPDDN